MNEPIIQGKLTLSSQVTPFLELCYLKLGIYVSPKFPKPPRLALLESRRAIKAVSNKVLFPTPSHSSQQGRSRSENVLSAPNYCLNTNC